MICLWFVFLWGGVTVCLCFWGVCFVSVFFGSSWFMVCLWLGGQCSWFVYGFLGGGYDLCMDHLLFERAFMICVRLFMLFGGACDLFMDRFFWMDVLGRCL